MPAGGLGVGRTMVGSAILFGPSMLLVPLTPESFPVPFLVAGIALLSFAAVVFNVTGLSFTQAIVLGSVTGGVLATAIGLRPTLVPGAAGATASFVPLVLSPIRSLGPMEEALREHAPALEPAVADA